MEYRGLQVINVTDSELLPKVDIQLERAVLGCIINDPADAHKRLTSVSPEDFTDAENIAVYHALLKSWREKGVTDFVSVGSYLIGNTTALTNLSSCVGAVGVGADFDKHLQRLKEITTERRAHQTALRLIKDMHADKCNIGETIAELQRAQSHSTSFEAYKCDAYFSETLSDVKPLLLCRNTGIVYPGDITTVQGQAKTRKTTLIGSAIATMTSGEPCLHFSVTKPLKVLLIDTEQSEYNLQNQGYRTRMLGADMSQITVLALRPVPGASNRLDLTLQAANAIRPDIIIIDNVKDFVTDFNNNEESDTVVRSLMKLAGDLQIGIISVIHENYNTDKARGHVGSYLIEKASSQIRTECVPEDKGITKVSFPKTRNAPVEEFSFRLDEDVLPELVDYTPPGNYEELRDLFTKVFSEIKDGCRHKDLTDAVMSTKNVKVTRAKLLIKQARQSQIIFVSQEKYYLSNAGHF